MEDYDVIVCGSLHYDIVVDAPRLPQTDETLPGSAWRPVFGGKGRNQAVAAVINGARTAMIGAVGDDDFGDSLRRDLIARHVDASRVTIKPGMGSGMSVAIVDDAGNYGAVIVTGTNAFAEQLSKIEGLGKKTVAVLQNEISDGANLAFARASKEGGATTVYNAAPARVGQDELLKLTDILVVNIVEAEMMSGESVTDEKAAIDIALSLSPTTRSVILTLGAHGCVIASHNACEHVEGIPTEVVSTHGAGDMFIGSLAARLSTGTGLQDACVAANTAASRYVGMSLEARAALGSGDWQDS